MEAKPKYHPAPLGQQSKPAELVEITYLTSVTSPDFKVGEAGETKKIERHWAEQLVAEGYACFTAESEVKDGSDQPRSDPASPGS
jgi:hypothetical protein